MFSRLFNIKSLLVLGLLLGLGTATGEASLGTLIAPLATLAVLRGAFYVVVGR